MKAVILAAGKGSRISNLTGGGPKSLLPLGDTTLLGHSLRNFKTLGIDDIIVVTGYQRNLLAEYVRREWPGRAEIVYNPHFASTNVLYSFWLALPHISPDEDFVFLHADTVFSFDVLKRLIDQESQSGMVFAVDRHPCEEEEMKVQVSSGHVTHVNKQMPGPSAFGEFLGLARIGAKHQQNLRRHAEQLFEDGVFQAFFELAVQRMIDAGEVQVEVCDVTGHPWREVDFQEDYEAAKVLFA